MLTLTRIGGSTFQANATMIELIESTPDTVITMVSGRKYVVRESADQVTQQVTQYYRSIGLIGTLSSDGRLTERNES